MHKKLDKSTLTPLTENAAGDVDALESRLPRQMLSGELAVGFVRRYLAHAGLDPAWPVFYLGWNMFADLDRHLEAIGEQDAVWHAPAFLDEMEGCAQPTFASIEHNQQIHTRPGGYLYLPAHDVLFVRLQWILPGEASWDGIEMAAAPTPDHLLKLQHDLEAAQRAHRKHNWTVIGGAAAYHHREEETVAEGLSFNEMVLPRKLRARLEREVFSFFSDSVKAGYEKLKVPYRRGVLLFGPPGCGKTTICQAVAERWPQVNAFLVRPGGSFDSDALVHAFYMAAGRAPSILLFEDIDLLLEQPGVNLSVMLNLLDGVGKECDGGVLVLATTNNPERLTESLSNRPGRFTGLEIPAPPARQRSAYFLRLMPEIEKEALKQLVKKTEGLSCAHLQEIFCLAGLIAMEAQREERTLDDLTQACEQVVESHNQARENFRSPQRHAFGFTKDAGGWVSYSDEEDTPTYTEDDIPF